MNRLDRAIEQVHRLDDRAAGDSPLHRMPAGAKLLALLFYLVLLMSFSRYDPVGVLSFLAVLLVLYPLAGLSLAEGLQSARGAVFFLAALGLVNAFAASGPAQPLGPFFVPGGFLTFLVLLLKGILSVLAVVLLLSTTRMEEIGASLLAAGVPKVLAVTLLLVVRYLVLLLQEGRRMNTAWQLRAPGLKGLPRRLWGSFLGMWLLRSLDRAQRIYEAMELRGFSGYFPVRTRSKKEKRQGVFLFLGTVFYCAACRILLG